MKKLILGGIILLNISFAYAYEVIELYYKEANDILPNVQTMLRSDEAISSIDNKLIINASTARAQELVQLIRQLDQKTDLLLVEVDQSGNAQNHTTQINADGQIIIQNKKFDASGSANAQINRSHSRNQGVQTLRIMSGNEGFIQLGQDDYYSDGRYKNTSQGFRIVPKLIGDSVKIDIYAQNKDQRLATTVQGRLGQWIDLGAINSHDENNQRSLLGYERSNQKSTNAVRIRITKTH